MVKPALAVDWGGTKVMTGLVGADGQLMGSRSASTCSGLGAIRAQLLDMVAATIQEHQMSAIDLAGIGVTVPGLADPNTGTLIYAPAHDFHHVPVSDWFHSVYTTLPVVVENDVNACAWGEMHYGVGTSHRSFLWVTVSTGIGGGLVLNGRLYRGARGMAGELGHVVVQEAGQRCGCGQYGCLEAVAAGPAIARRMQELLHSTDSPDSNKGAPLTAADVAAAARTGDALAQRVWYETGCFLGRALAAAANLLDLEMVVFGGGVSRSLDLMLPAIEATVREGCMGVRNGGQLYITSTKLGYEAALVGAAALIHHPMLVS